MDKTLLKQHNLKEPEKATLYDEDKRAILNILKK